MTQDEEKELELFKKWWNDLPYLLSTPEEIAEQGWFARAKLKYEKDILNSTLIYLASELAQYASYAEMTGNLNINREPIRKFSDDVFSVIKQLEEF